MTEDEKGIADILLKAGTLAPERLDEVERVCLNNAAPLGTAVVQLGFASEEDVALAVSKLTKVPFASVKNNLLRPERGEGLRQLVDPQFARDNVLLPLYAEDGVLSVAMLSPDNDLLKTALFFKAGMPIRPLIATRTEILSVLMGFYDLGGMDAV